MWNAPNVGSWTEWTPNSGPATLTLPNEQEIASLWIPIVPIAITVTQEPSGEVYVANSTGSSTGAETIPLVPGTTSVTLSASYASALYVFASSLPFNPFKQPQSGGGGTGVEAVTGTLPIESSGGTTPDISLLISANAGNIITLGSDNGLYAPGVPYAVRLRNSGSDFTPTGTGPDAGSIVVIPWSPLDDTTTVTWDIVDIFARCETTPSGGELEFHVDYSTSTGAYSSVGNIDSDGITIPASSYESSRPASLAVTTINSGAKIRVNYVSVNGAQGVSVYVLLKEPT